ncbi:SAM-dependent methyltransferase [Verrucomicrobiota bacterium]
MTVDDDVRRLLQSDRFPRASKYEVEWVIENQMGLHPLWLAEWVCEAVDLRKGMRVLDLGCGKAVSSIFLAREYGVQVWATDLWTGRSPNTYGRSGPRSAGHGIRPHGGAGAGNGRASWTWRSWMSCLMVTTCGGGGTRPDGTRGTSGTRCEAMSAS